MTRSYLQNNYNNGNSLAENMSKIKRFLYYTYT